MTCLLVPQAWGAPSLIYWGAERGPQISLSNSVSSSERERTLHPVTGSVSAVLEFPVRPRLTLVTGLGYDDFIDGREVAPLLISTSIFPGLPPDTSVIHGTLETRLQSVFIPLRIRSQWGAHALIELGGEFRYLARASLGFDDDAGLRLTDGSERIVLQPEGDLAVGLVNTEWSNITSRFRRTSVALTVAGGAHWPVHRAELSVLLRLTAGLQDLRPEPAVTFRPRSIQVVLGLSKWRP